MPLRPPILAALNPVDLLGATVLRSEQSHPFPTCPVLLHYARVGKLQIKVFFFYFGLSSDLIYYCLLAVHMTTAKFAGNRRESYQMFGVFPAKDILSLRASYLAMRRQNFACDPCHNPLHNPRVTEKPLHECYHCGQ
jgi:hypothetical protein